MTDSNVIPFPSINDACAVLAKCVVASVTAAGPEGGAG